MKRLLSIPTVKRPTKVRTLAKTVFMTGKISVREMMRRLELAAKPRPFYLIAHLCNDLGEVMWAVNSGANAIECDIEFVDAPHEFLVRHSPDEGVPIRPYLKGVAEFLKTQPQVAMFYFDLKDHWSHKMPRLLEIIRTHLTDVVPIPIMLSHAHYAGRNVFDEIKHKIRDPGEGLVIDMHDDPKQVQDFFIANKVVRYGFGNGVAAPGVPWNIPLSIMLGVALKWSKHTIRWVCTFTLAEQSSMRDYIAKGVDGFMANDVPAMVKVFNENAAKYRLRRATRDDDPFDVVVHPSYLLTVRTRDKPDAGTDANLTFELSGTAGKVSTTIDAFPRNMFEAGDTDYVTLIGTDVGDIQVLTLSHDGTGNKPDWFVQFVKVEKRGSPTVTFYFNQDIHAHRLVSRVPG